MNETIKMVGTGSYSTVTMRAFNGGTFTFKPKAIVQIVSAAGHARFIAEKEYNDYGTISKLKGFESFPLLAKFVLPALEVSHGLGYKPDSEQLIEEQPVQMQLTASELETIKVWVQVKHDHCEANQDKPEFNRDSFYEMKDLLLSIREVLMPKPLKEEH